MPTDFRTQTLNIPAGTGRRSLTGSVTFATRVNSANIALNGYKFDFVNADHHINIVEVDTDLLGISGNTVNYRVEFEYSDKNFDDAYRGYVTALIIADVA